MAKPQAYELYALAEPRQLHVRTRTYIIEQATDISLTPESDKHKATNANNKALIKWSRGPTHRSQSLGHGGALDIRYMERENGLGMVQSEARMRHSQSPGHRGASTMTCDIFRSSCRQGLFVGGGFDQVGEDRLSPLLARNQDGHECQ